MAPRKTAWTWIAICWFWSPYAAGADRLTAWLVLDAAKTGPARTIEGDLRVTGGTLRILEWMHDGKDLVEQAHFRITTEHDAKTAAAAKLTKAYRSTLPKGLLLELEAPTGAALRATTSLGEFQVPLERLRSEGTVTVLDGRARLQWIPNATVLTGNKAEEEFPSAALLPDGQVAVAYVAWNGESDQVMLRIGNEVHPVTEEPGDYLEPRCAVDGQGKLWVVWAANDGRQWDLWARSDLLTRVPPPSVKLTANRLNDFWPRLARDAHGRLWLAWQTVADDLHYEVMLARLGPEGLSDPVNVSEHAADDWEPAICSTADGRIVVAWDTYRNGSYDIYLREFSQASDGTLKPLQPPEPVAASARREAHATVAADSTGRVWIAWDVSVEDWGKHPEGAATLHSDRATEVACLAEGSLHRLGTDFMQSLPKPFGQFIEYPRIAVDGKDRVWLIFRLENRVHPFYTAPGRRAQSYGTWHLFACQFDGAGWSEPILLARTGGRQDIRPAVATDREGELLVVCAADGRTRRLPYMPVDYDVVLTSLAGFGTGMKKVPLADAGPLGQVAPVNPDPELKPLPRRWRVGGRQYRLVIGDTHRHTDISRCANGRDGSLQDAYRYALDACGLDWLAISDHDQDILKHRNDRIRRPRQDYDWWRSQKYCDLYSIPGRFVALYGYEHGGSYQARGGHKNVIYAERGQPVYEVDAPDELFAVLANSGALAIPHQLADGGSRTDWDQWNGQFERVAEIFQVRGSYEYQGCPREARVYTSGFSMWDALAGGVRIGIIASSDHGQTHQARAGVYVEVDSATEGARAATPFTRQGIVKALRARRAFGATTAVAMQVNVNEYPLGQEVVISGAPTIEAKVTAPDVVTRMDVIRAGRFVYTTEPKSEEAAFTFQDIDLKAGQSAYYYVRAAIGTDDFAWSSPVWVTRVQ